MGRAVRADRAVLSEAGQWPPADRGRADAARLFLQQWFNLSDPAVKEALYGSLAMRRFVEIDLGREPVPDETTVCRFRHLPEQHDLGRAPFDEAQRHLAVKAEDCQGYDRRCNDHQCAVFHEKRREGARSRYASHKEGQPVVFRMKAHFGVDSRSKLIHAVVTTPANAADSTVLPDLPHGKETRVWGSGLARPTGSDPTARGEGPGFCQQPYRHRGIVDEVDRAKNRTKSRVRARVEHAIGVIKRVFGLPRCAIAGSRRTRIA